MIAKNTIVVSKELSEFIVGLSKEEFSQLEANLIAEGCHEPLIIWQKENNQYLLIDGHNRYKICQKHNIPFKTRKVSFDDLNQARAWMIDNQMGRRNLTPDQLSYYRGLKYLTFRKEKGGYENVKSKGKSLQTTAELLSDKFSISESTIKRDAKFAEGIDIIGKSNPILRRKILSGEAKVKKVDVQTLTSATNKERLTIRNEADLYNKAKVIREHVLEEIEKGILKVNDDKLEKAKNVFKFTDPVFLNKDDRLKRIKGMIISAINRAINNKDIQAIKELKKLIDKLAEEIF